MLTDLPSDQLAVDIYKPATLIELLRWRLNVSRRKLPISFSRMERQKKFGLIIESSTEGPDRSALYKEADQRKVYRLRLAHSCSDQLLLPYHHHEASLEGAGRTRNGGSLPGN